MLKLIDYSGHVIVETQDVSEALTLANNDAEIEQVVDSDGNVVFLYNVLTGVWVAEAVSLPLCGACQKFKQKTHIPGFATCQNCDQRTGPLYPNAKKAKLPRFF